MPSLPQTLATANCFPKPFLIITHPCYERAKGRWETATLDGTQKKLLEEIRECVRTSGLPASQVLDLLEVLLFANLQAHLPPEEAETRLAALTYRMFKRIPEPPSGLFRKEVDGDDLDHLYSLQHATALRYADDDKAAEIITRQEPTVSKLRYDRLDEPVRLLARTVDPSASWLTIGDGRFGRDAATLCQLGFRDVTASDICAEALKQAQALGIIPAYREENAEHLSLADNSVDYVWCRDSYHHIPRAPLALYQMLRVARQAVILVEPQDPAIDPPSRPSKSRHYGYEPDGNFVFSLSRREVIKVAFAMGLGAVALKGQTDYYSAALEGANRDTDPEKYNEWLRIIGVINDAVAQGLTNHSYLMAILFKRTPDAATITTLRQEGWEVRPVPRHPKWRHPAASPESSP